MRFKKHLGLILLFTSLLTCCLGQTKRALIFAIGKYPDDSGWPEISSSRDDSLITRALRSQQFTDITSVSDQRAGIDDIKNSLDQLISRSRPGDIVLIHVSSHGERLEDLTGNKPDGLEESIVTYDGRLPSYGTEPTAEEIQQLRRGYFRDDEFGKYIDKLRARLGPGGDVIVLLDLCYAGTGTRGMAKVRGGRPPLVSPGFSSRQHTQTPDSKQVLPLPEDNKFASYVVIGAARANESDNEMTDDAGRSVGPLSYAVSHVFATLDSSMTYRSLFAKIESVMNEKVPGQHPVLSGNGLDRTLFGGRFQVQHSYIQVNSINGKELSLNAGKFYGLDSGARVALYPAGTLNPLNGEQLADGTVTRAGLYDADVRLDKDPGIRQAAAGWVFVTSRTFKDIRVNVGLAGRVPALPPRSNSPAFSVRESEHISAAISRIPGARLAGNPELLVTRGTGGAPDSILVSPDGRLFDTIRSAADTAMLAAKIKTYMRYKFLRSVNISDPEANLEVRLLPIVNGVPDTTFIHKSAMTFRAGDKMMLWVRNGGRKNLYFNALDLQPDGVINAILPNSSQGIFADDLMVPPGSSHLFVNYVIAVEPPYGREIFKIFASVDKIDLEAIAASHGAVTRGNLSPFEALVRRSFNLRGLLSQNIANPNGSSYNLYFDILPAK